MSDLNNQQPNDPEGILDAEKQLAKTNLIRDKLIGKLETALDNIDFKITDWDAEDKEAIMSVVNATGSLLNSRDGSVISIVKLKLASKKEDRESNNAAIIAELLDRVSLTDKRPKVTTTAQDLDVDKALEELHIASGDAISSAELELIKG